MADINIYGKLVNATPEGVLAESEQIKDSVQNKKQSEINTDYKNRLESVEGKIENSLDYNNLTNKPQIGGVELTGDKSISDLGIQPAGDYATTTQLGEKLDTNTYNSDKATFATKTELEGKADKTAIADMETKTNAAATYQPKGDYLTSIPEEYITETELNEKSFATTTQLGEKLDTNTYNSDKATFATKTELGTKQDTLVSGTNIKSLNNVSILGEGNIDIAPTIGENGHWYINGEDTGKPARGEDGVSMGEIALVQDPGTDTGSENKVMSQKAVSLAIDGVAKCVPISNVTEILQ